MIHVTFDTRVGFTAELARKTRILGLFAFLPLINGLVVAIFKLGEVILQLTVFQL